MRRNFSVTTDRYAGVIGYVWLNYDIPSDITRNILDMTFHT